MANRVIEFQTKPDPVFLAILTESLQWMRDELHPWVGAYQPTPGEIAELDENYRAMHPSLAHFFNPLETLTQTERLLSALHDQTLYRPTDYHWLIIYDALNVFTDLHNDDAFGRGGEVGPYIIDRIDFDHIVTVFFFDTDFLFGTELFVAEENMHGAPGVTPQARQIAAGIKPRGEDVVLTPIEDADSEMSEPAEERQHPPSGYVGPYPMLESDSDDSQD